MFLANVTSRHSSMDAGNISSMSLSGPPRTRTPRFTRQAHGKAINGFIGGIKGWNFARCPMFLHKIYMSWRSSSSNSESDLLRFSKPGYGPERHPGYGMRRGGIYCFGFVFET